MPKLTTLVLGGINSGKSAFAEALITNQTTTPYYVATSVVLDQETQEKVNAHKTMRGPNWHTIEEPVDLGAALKQLSAGSVVLVDCLTMWLNNLMYHELDVEDYTDHLLETVAQSELDITFVSNEVGLGGISENALTRKFARFQGTLNQRIAEQSDRVAFVAAGLPMWLKGGN
jgi:adenosylcobinamide kinase/adenosylcobinamide-phosphate guanylyltransferase